MNRRHDGFTIHELEALSGFDRRTIAYYSQEGLLPKVGRRGRGTVYPGAFKERLMFIRAVRDLQDAGTLRAVSLAEIKNLMTTLDTDALTSLQRADDSASAIRSLFDDPDWDTRDIAVPAEDVAAHKTNYREAPYKRYGPNGARILGKDQLRTKSNNLDANGVDGELTSTHTLIQAIEQAVLRSDGQKDGHQDGLERAISAPLSAHITVSVRGLQDDQADLLRQLVERLLEPP